ncbi:hypothetical protein L593_03300 [Salinarchaeum sp. Harcht-Bsk1]|uniref:DUF7318 family protein n=1 Tax=Salinarchaeum sp. Harcht-Bsk1 TaxID=1333523 RepID=UPI0003423687|nr:hypothetical protein [Salinarchaeum sp. Harcht-Bsk1]AGN00611.1 hypothetical protein L593_03300 [Salinarchaeum sp. Harcht-Bsk1]
MATKGSNYGDIHRYEPARESLAAAIAIVLLTVIEVALTGLFTYGLVEGWGIRESGNIYLGTLLGLLFINLGIILALYRKEFLPDVMIVKKRRRKWEDLYVTEDSVDGDTLGGDLGENLKRAVYPYYKK